MFLEKLKSRMIINIIISIHYNLFKFHLSQLEW